VFVATLTKVGLADVSTFLTDYPDLGSPSALEGIPAGSVNSNYALKVARDGKAARVFLRIYEEQGFEGARAEAAMLVQLEARGVPCVAPFARADGTRLGRLAGKPAALFAWRDGTMRCQASVSVSDAEKVGAAVARIHLAGEGIPVGPHRFGHPALIERLGRIAGARDPELARQADLLGPLLDAVHASRRALPEGLVHGDLFRDNVLWDSTEAPSDIATLLDFESAAHGPFVYDLAVVILAWCFGDGPRDDLAAAMVRGYESVRPLSPDEHAGFRAEARMAALRFTITRITDYAMRGDEAGPRVIKDWRRFYMRYQALTDGAFNF
jgi:homoserine kinase type II